MQGKELLTEEEEDTLKLLVKKIGKEMDIKRKEGLKRLKERLGEIMNDQEIHLD